MTLMRELSPGSPSLRILDYTPAPYLDTKANTATFLGFTASSDNTVPNEEEQSHAWPEDQPPPSKKQKLEDGPINLTSSGMYYPSFKLLDGMILEDSDYLYGLNNTVLGKSRQGHDPQLCLDGLTVNGNGEIIDNDKVVGQIEILGQPIGSAIISSEQQEPMETFLTMKFPLDHPHLASQNREIRSKCSATEDFTPVYLAHARLYILAEKYDIVPLRMHVLSKIRHTLQGATYCHEIGVGYHDLISLIRFVDGSMLSTARIDPLRELLISYLAGANRWILLSPECRKLVGEDADLAMDLVAVLARLKPSRQF